ncbi:hypothetical protein PsWM33_05412 [Pseudovibrio sp. WM33]|nr:hypothetical protein PsWM33_05412 [Pseudovibrio sp. WM33]
MSLTQSLKEVVQSTTALTEAVQKTYSQHNAEIQKILNIAPELQRTFYVDAVNGDNSNDGSQDAPLRTLRKAADRVPRQGRGHIHLLSDYHMTEAVYARDCYINVYGDETGHRRVTFGSYLHASDGEESRALHGFRWVGSSYFNFCYLDLRLPVVVTDQVGVSSSTYSAIVSCATSANTGNQGVTFRYGNIHIPTEEEGAPAGHVLGPAGPVAVFFSNITASGAGLKKRISRNDRAGSYVMNITLDELP